MTWNISTNGVQEQVSLNQARERFQSGRLKPDDLVFAPNTTKWYPASAFETELSKPYAIDAPFNISEKSIIERGNKYGFAYFIASAFEGFGVLALICVALFIIAVTLKYGLLGLTIASWALFSIPALFCLIAYGQLLRAQLDTARSLKKLEGLLSRP